MIHLECLDLESDIPLKVSKGSSVLPDCMRTAPIVRRGRTRENFSPSCYHPDVEPESVPCYQKVRSDWFHAHLREAMKAIRWRTHMIAACSGSDAPGREW